ncbi:urea transporter [Spirosoma sp. SC4-14]|uniref:urea transporter n=1 Tax=Spirosoma sp. SC4-14 TaxID=3128900 RepID=UPI0030D36711
MKELIKTIVVGGLNSYAQLFFTQNKITGMLLLAASMVDPQTGIWGLLGVVVCNAIALGFGMSPSLVQQGVIGYNSILVSLGLASMLPVSERFFCLFGLACLSTVFLSAGSFQLMRRLNLPSLSFAFLIVYWAVALSLDNFPAIKVNSLSRVQLTHWYNIEAPAWFPVWLYHYLTSLGSILFQSNLIAGLLAVTGLLWASRIQLTLSLLGFGVGYLLFIALGGNPIQISHHYIGFNFILTAMALGGFFYIPNWRTYGLALLAIAVMILLATAELTLFEGLNLPILSLPFVMIVPLTLYVMRMRQEPRGLMEVVHQQHSPEKNLYSFSNYQQRFGKSTYVQIGLPFFGEWVVYQGYNGQYTHKDAYRFAWDFVIRDATQKSFRSSGHTADDYYGYGMPVVAPAAGYVVGIVDGIEDNPIGNMNIKENWGNVIVIKHTDYLYSKIAHLKKDMFTVRVGDYVRKGDVVGALGNSGRSPEPHIHFQLQATPEVEAPTIQYPIAYYLLKNEQEVALNCYDVPQENETITNIKTSALLRDAFGFMPGQLIRFEAEIDQQRIEEEWSVGTTSLNEPYLHCAATASTVYFVNDGTMFYCSAYIGPRHTLLHYFYLAAYKVMLGFYRNTSITDLVPLHQLDRGPGRFLQDFAAPFFIYRRYRYQLNYDFMDNPIRPTVMFLQSSVNREVLDRSQTLYRFEIRLEHQTISQFTVWHAHRIINIRQVLDNSEQPVCHESSLALTEELV